MTASATRYWSDIETGDRYGTGRVAISRRDILEFAADFDPQPYHLDAEAADASIFGGLCASGWHVTAVMMRLLTDEFVSRGIDLLGSNGVSRLRWRKPVFADDTLSAVIAVADKTPSSGDPRFGYVDCDVEVSNQHGDPVISLRTSLMIGTGPAQISQHG
jgi:acyl dehydratase